MIVLLAPQGFMVYSLKHPLYQLGLTPRIQFTDMSFCGNSAGEANLDSQGCVVHTPLN